MIQVGPKCNHQCAKREAEGDLTYRGGDNVKLEAEMGLMWPQAKECEELPEARRGKEWIFPKSLWSLLILAQRY